MDKKTTDGQADQASSHWKQFVDHPLDKTNGKTNEETTEWGKQPDTSKRQKTPLNSKTRTSWRSNPSESASNSKWRSWTSGSESSDQPQIATTNEERTREALSYILKTPPFVLHKSFKGPQLSIDDVCPNFISGKLVIGKDPSLPTLTLDNLSQHTQSLSSDDSKFAEQSRWQIPIPRTQPQNAENSRGRNNYRNRNTGSNQYPPSTHPDDIVYNGRRCMFNQYINPETIGKLFENNQIYRGVIRINRINRSEAYVTSDELDNDIFISDVRDRNRALEGDVVAIRLKDVDKAWNMKKDKDQARRIQRNSNDDYIPDEAEENAKKPKYAGEVVRIISRVENMVYPGKLSINLNTGNRDQDKDHKSSTPYDPRQVWFRPTDKKTPFIAIPIEHAPHDILVNEEYYDKVIMLAKITHWPITSKNPYGVIEKELGPIGDIKVETDAILADSNVQDGPFSDLALRGLPPQTWAIPQSEIDKRRDLRKETVFTIDPPTARDLDDAVHIKKLEDGNYEVGVHIADVTYFLKPNTPLDTEARSRGTSTYLVDRVIPMLPSLLSEKLCSLNPDSDRLAFSVIWKMDSVGSVLDTWFGRTVIRSCAKLSYGDAQSVIDGEGLPASVQLTSGSFTDIQNAIFDFFRMSQFMRKRRYANGALSMFSVKLCFTLNKDGDPETIQQYEQKEANRLIEEFMLQANISVAEKIAEHFPDSALLRRHDPPVPRRLEEFIRSAQELGCEIDGETSGSLQESFDEINDPLVKTVILLMAIKPMQRAKYFCAGSVSEEKHLHYALNELLYSHFTSPIRRYADVIVHRQLQDALDDKDGMNKKEIHNIATNCNRKRDGAKLAQDNNIQLYLARYLYNLEKVKEITQLAIVVSINKSSYNIHIPEYGIEKRIHMDSLPLTGFEYTKGSLEMFWKRGVMPSRDLEEKLYEQPRQRDDFSDDEDEEDEEDEAAKDQAAVEKAFADMALKEPSAPMVAKSGSSELDESRCMQRVKVFTNLDVRIQVNMLVSPPIINVYPLNPFMEKQ
ncbi:hypothetical protein CLU79DRAFT_734178 [Phycomyces nitens]|nr:hypothetical protein CLU79DRAFT_734178 [Phycomyces nitens]